MSSEEISRSLPPNKSRELDPDRLRRLLTDALRASLDIFSETEPSQSLTHPIYRPQKGGFRQEHIVLPYYNLLSEDLANAISSREVQALLDYLWDHGRMRETLKGPDPDRNSWESFAFRDTIGRPLSQILRTAAIDEAVRTGEFTSWRLPEESLERVVNDVAWHIRNGGYRYTARCILAAIEGESGEVLELGERASLRFHTMEERLKYLSRNARKLPLRLSPRKTFWDKYPILEIQLAISQSRIEEGPTERIEETVSRQVANAIDLVKWALMAAMGQKVPLVEGEIFFECFSADYRSARINNHQLKRQNEQQSPVYDTPSCEELDTVRELLRHTPKVRRQSNPVDNALWHFGRSCLESLPRDQLLESAIGLENLLMHGRSSGYRLKLSGAALMATTSDEAESIAEQLSKIWDSRGTVAHSSERDVDLAKEARRLLAKAIFSIMELVRDGELQPSQQNIPKEIQDRILREVPFCTEDGS